MMACGLVLCSSSSSRETNHRPSFPDGFIQTVGVFDGWAQPSKEDGFSTTDWWNSSMCLSVGQIQVLLGHILHVCGPRQLVVQVATQVTVVSTTDPLMERGEGGCSSPEITSNSIILLSVGLCWVVSLFSLSCLCWLLCVCSSSPILPDLVRLPSPLYLHLLFIPAPSSWLVSIQHSSNNLWTFQVSRVST